MGTVASGGRPRSAASTGPTITLSARHCNELAWSVLHIARFIVQNARHQTDTDIPDRHTSLNPLTLVVQTDVSDGFLRSGGPKVGGSNPLSPTNKSPGQGRPLGVGPKRFRRALCFLLHSRVDPGKLRCGHLFNGGHSLLEDFGDMSY